MNVLSCSSSSRDPQLGVLVNNLHHAERLMGEPAAANGPCRATEWCTSRHTCPRQASQGLAPAINAGRGG